MTFPEHMTVTVEIDGVDRTSYIVPDTIDIRSVLTKQLDTAKFTMEKASAVEPISWQEVIIRDGSEKIFGGYVLRKTQRSGADLNLDFTVSCTDYAVVLEKAIVKLEYEDQTDAYILNDLFDAYLPVAFDATTFVTAVKEHPKIRFNRMTLREIVDQLADLAGADWYMDYDKKLHFFLSEDAVAPFSLSQSPDLTNSFPFYSLRRQTDGSGVINRIEIVGGNYLSDDQTFLIAGTGQDERAILPFKTKKAVAESAIKVWRNDWVSGVNRCLNPSFEVNVTDFWNLYQCTSAQSATWADVGTYSMRISPSASVVSASQWTNAPTGVNDGDTVSARSQVKNTSGADVSVRIGIYNGTTWDYSAYTVLTNNEENTIFWTTAVGSGGGAAVVEWVVWTGFLADYYYIDAIQIEIYPYATAYFDGTMGEVVWEGTAHNSNSIRTATPESAVWTELTVKVGYLDELTSLNETLHYYQEHVLEALFPWPNIENAIKVFGRWEIPLRTRVTDQASYDFYGLGQWFDGVISDIDITDKNTARLRGKARLAEEAMARSAVSCGTRKPGLKSGMSLPLVSPLHGINDTFLVREVTATIGIDGSTEFALELGIVDEDLIDIMMVLIRQSKEKPIWREDEVLDELLDWSETFIFGTEVTNLTPRNPSTNPYDWGVDADDFDWGFGKWQ